jgi:hypothetical protein
VSENLPQRVCATCGRVLERWVSPDGTEEQFRHSHIDQPETHAPVPVKPQEAASWTGRCDFCSADNPAWVLPARDFQFVQFEDDEYDTGSAGGWAACDECARLIRQNAWTRLVTRAQAHYEEKHGPMHPQAALAMRVMYRNLRKNVTGSLRPITEG